MPLYYHTSITVAKCGILSELHFQIVYKTLQNRATKVIMGRKNIHGQSEIALNELGWKHLDERRSHFIAKITYDSAPKSLTEIFRKSNASLQYNLRGSSTKFHLPRPRTEYLKKSLSYRGAHLWNSLSTELRNKDLFFQPGGHDVRGLTDLICLYFDLYFRLYILFNYILLYFVSLR